MDCYRVELVVRSPISTPLLGDTIFGHVCWGIALHEGARAVGDFLAACGEVEPAFVVSSAFPRGMLPRPELPPTASAWRDTDDYALAKQRRRTRWVPAERLCNGPVRSAHELTEGLTEERFRDIGTLRTRNVINRLTSTTMDEGLFEFAETHLYVLTGPRVRDIEPMSLDLYVLSEDCAERVSQLLEWAFEGGYGADASTGSGALSIEGVVDCNFPESGNRAMALGPFALAGEAPPGLCADVFTRNGRLGGWFVHTEPLPFKAPVVLYQQGATFPINAPLSHVGRLLDNVHVNPAIRQAALAPVLMFDYAGGD